MIFDYLAWMTGPIPASVLVWLAIILFVAGVSRGLSGFGAAMLFIPLASAMVGPQLAIGVMWMVDTPASAPISLRATRRASLRDPLLLLAAWAIAAPIGLTLLNWLDPLVVRWFICVMILGALTALIAGWTYRGKPTLALTLATGLVAGLAGGLTGMSGPPIVLMWLAAAAATAANVRDNVNVFYLMQSLLNGLLLAWWGILNGAALRLGLLLILPYAAGIGLGAMLFRRLGERDFRRVSYLIIAIAAILALPHLDRAFGR